MMPNWPLILLTTVTFKEIAGSTSVRLSQTPMDANTAEIACFAEAMANMDKGWGSGFNAIEEILAEMQP